MKSMAASARKVRQWLQATQTRLLKTLKSNAGEWNGTAGLSGSTPSQMSFSRPSNKCGSFLNQHRRKMQAPVVLREAPALMFCCSYIYMYIYLSKDELFTRQDIFFDLLLVRSPLVINAFVEAACEAHMFQGCVPFCKQVAGRNLPCQNILTCYVAIRILQLQCSPHE